MDMQTPAERHLMLDASDLLSARWPLPQKRSACNIIILMETINDTYTHAQPNLGVYRRHRTGRQVRRWSVGHDAP
jgi:hypothetical protein